MAYDGTGGATDDEFNREDLSAVYERRTGYTLHRQTCSCPPHCAQREPDRGKEILPDLIEKRVSVIAANKAVVRGDSVARVSQRVPDVVGYGIIGTQDPGDGGMVLQVAQNAGPLVAPVGVRDRGNSGTDVKLIISAQFSYHYYTNILLTIQSANHTKIKKSADKCRWI